jgi:predicted AAA+ superfamily ATPase
MIEKLIEIQLSLARDAEKITFKRYIFSRINWQSHLIGIVGARGVGKTTLLLQYYLNSFESPQECLYFSADNINVINQGLYNIAEEFFKYGGKVLLLDEVHKYPNWQQELKNIYDSFPKKRIVFSGSSTVNILKAKADLSRRAVFYNLNGLSFREFLKLHLGQDFNVIEFSELLKNHIRIANKINSKISVLKHFREYLRYGYYPFFTEGVDSYYNKLSNVAEKIFCEDIPAIFNIKQSSIYNLKRLFYLVATSQPFIPNVARLSSQLKISKEYIYTYIEELEKAHLFTLLYPKAKGFKLLRKPQKIYLENANLFYLIEQEKGFVTETGSIRETFFLNQLRVLFKLFYTEGADFIDNRKRRFEIGGKNKKAPSPDIIYAVDEITVGFKNRIPLWLFGFLY